MAEQLTLQDILNTELNGQNERAGKLYATLEEKEGDSLEFCYHYGKYLNKNKRFKEALPLLLKASEQEQGALLLWYEMALSYEGIGRLDGAENAFYNAAELARVTLPTAQSVEFYTAYLNFYMRHNRIEDLKKHLPLMEKIEDVEPFSRHFRAVVDYFDGDYDSCIQKGMSLFFREGAPDKSLFPYIAFAMFYKKDINGLEAFFEKLLIKGEGADERVAAKCLIVLREVLLFEEGVWKASAPFVELDIQDEECFQIKDKMYFTFVRSVVGFYHTLKSLYDFRLTKEGSLPYKKPVGAVCEDLCMVGDSHILSPAHMLFEKEDGSFFEIKPHLSLGIKAWHVASHHMCRPLHAFKMKLEALSEGGALLVSAGEIDCRVDEGFIAHAAQKGEEVAFSYIEEVVEDFVEEISLCAQRKNLSFVGVLNIPAPKFREDKPHLVQEKRAEIIKCFNTALKASCDKKGVCVVDIYHLTVDDQGHAKQGCHFDEVHLNPDVYVEALTARFKD